ncbi:HPP family protein [Brevundimonas sp. Root1279]|uniref:HPP family protein n=1 Tax=Brevundimonas sp. Root1279 TaxID=1736443 RepID=UPI0006F48A09|nr:HPP family protein [Brevundimonas sp. Root1279]KQW81956.1 hypothetical protein ASC65_11785 [Brevundimonas sp. Root1279]
MKVFQPILAGATIRDRIVACLGALIGIAVTGLVSRALLPGQAAAGLILTASMGASAVLLFVVPASPLAQPWSIIGGNVISAAVGVTAALLIKDPIVAGAVAVAASIAAMSLARCLHPPGGGAALVAVLGGPVIAGAGYSFVVSPVLIDAVLLTATGYLFHRFSGHAYPHRTAAVAQPAGLELTEADVDAALAEFGEPLDVSRDDLRLIAQTAASRAFARVSRP